MQKLSEEFNTWSKLKETKNLLAFSAGVDSSALFYMLIEKDIKFDIAIVDYNVRENSKNEVCYAEKLAKKYSKKIFIKSVHIDSSNFEAKAREIRYKFFENVIVENKLDTLITAHHLGDKLEWFFMRLIRGAGAVELNGFSEIETNENYQIVRPLIYTTKNELFSYLTCKNIEYFIDESNFDEKYERNYFRKNFSDPLLLKHKDGIVRTFKALEKDKTFLFQDRYRRIKSLYFFKKDINYIRLSSKILKLFEIVLSSKQREEFEKSDNFVISGKVAVGKSEGFVYIAPYLKNVVMTKEFKEECRISKIPPHIRSYLFSENINIEDIKLEAKFLTI